MTDTAAARRHALYYEECPSCYGCGEEGGCSLCGNSGEVTSYAAELYRRRHFELAREAAAGQVLSGELPEAIPQPPMSQMDRVTLGQVLPAVVDSLFKSDPLLAYLKRRG